jgi:hypothetical protein
MCTYTMRCELPEWNYMLILLRRELSPKFHINKVSLGYFYCNVHFCVGYGTDI